MKSMSIGLRLSLGLGVILLILVFIGLRSVMMMSSVKQSAATLKNEFIPAVEVANKVERHARATMFEIQSYALTEEPEYLKTGKEALTVVFQDLKAADKLGSSTPNLKPLQAAAVSANKSFKDYEQRVNQLAIITDDLEESRITVDRAAKKYLSACESLIKLQDKKLTEALEKKVPTEDALDIKKKSDRSCALLNLGNVIVAGTWKAQFRRGPEIFEETKASFVKVDALLSEVSKMNLDDEEARLLSNCRASVTVYKTGIDDFLSSWAKRESTNRARADAARKVVGEAETIARTELDAARMASEKDMNFLTQSSNVLLSLVAGAVLLGSIISYLTPRSIGPAIQSCVETMKHLANGDLTARATVHRKDELGTLATAINQSIDSLRTTMATIAQSADQLSRSATSLADIAHTQSAGAERTNIEASAVATAGKHLAASAKNMSATAQDINQSTSSVAAAMEEMASSIAEVARSCSKESEIAKEAETQTQKSRDLMSKLDSSAIQIGKVVELINHLAEQTDLLALNATIEAASAGESGRGFAVVANEVKELAKQSANATEDIRTQIHMIQQNTSESADGIERVVTVIQEVSNIAATIAAAVEEQSATTTEIVKTLHNVSTATDSLAKDVHHTADGSADISRNIHEVSEVSAAAVREAIKINTSAAELSELAKNLSELTSRFQFEIPSTTSPSR